MKTIRYIFFIFEYTLFGLIIAASYLFWQADFSLIKLIQPFTASEPDIITTTQPITNIRPLSFAKAVKSSSGSVVTIYTRKTVTQTLPSLLQDPALGKLFGDQLKKFTRDKTETNLGSGVIITDSGYILTNQHVVDGADEILISLADGRSSQARLVGQDKDTDIAVLHITLNNLKSIRVIDDDSEIQVGDIALAIGNPLNVGQTVTMGIISATGRNRIGLSTFENFIQTDAAINPGNSGGALINANGHLIGINTAIFSRSGGSQGIGFAIPSSLAINVMEEILTNGKVRRGWLGVEGTEITAKAALNSGNPNIRGVLIEGVFINSPADKAGVETGDIIVAINEKRVYRVRNVLEIIAGHKPGDEITIGLLRGNKSLSLSLITTERP